MSNKKIIVFGVFLLTQACAQIDDYMLGKDNTLKPETLSAIKPKVTLNKKWSVSTGKASKAAKNLKLNPVIQGLILYTADSSGTVQAIDRESAQVIWSKQLSHGIISGPSIAHGRIALATNAASIVLLNQKTGDEIWQTKISGDSLAKPVITSQAVVVKTINGNLYALNITNGEKQWVTEHSVPNLILKASSSPVVLKDYALVGYPDGKLGAVDINTGSILWQRGIAYANGASDVERLVDIDADPIVRGNIAYLAGYQGYIGAFSLKDGQFVWRKPASTYKNIAISTQDVFLTDSDDVVWAYDRLNGRVKWKQPGLKARSLTEPVLMGDRLLVGDKTGYLHILSTKNGEFLSRTQLSGGIFNAPAVAGKDIYVVTGNGKLNRYSVS